METIRIPDKKREYKQADIALVLELSEEIRQA